MRRRLLAIGAIVVAAGALYWLLVRDTTIEAMPKADAEP